MSHNSDRSPSNLNMFRIRKYLWSTFVRKDGANNHTHLCIYDNSACSYQVCYRWQNKLHSDCHLTNPGNNRCDQNQANIFIQCHLLVSFNAIIADMSNFVKRISSA